MPDGFEPAIILAIGAFVSGSLVGWAYGFRSGQKRARPGLSWHEFIRENAAYDFDVVRTKALQIGATANEIAQAAGRAANTVRTASNAKIPTQRGFHEPISQTEGTSHIETLKDLS